jgi:hypothetical protein
MGYWVDRCLFNIGFIKEAIDQSDNDSLLSRHPNIIGGAMLSTGGAIYGVKNYKSQNEKLLGTPAERRSFSYLNNSQKADVRYLLERGHRYTTTVPEPLTETFRHLPERISQLWSRSPSSAIKNTVVIPGLVGLGTYYGLKKLFGV